MPKITDKTAVAELDISDGLARKLTAVGIRFVEDIRAFNADELMALAELSRTETREVLRAIGVKNSRPRAANRFNFSEEHVAMMRELDKMGQSYTGIANIIGCNAATVKRYVTGKNSAHANRPPSDWSGRTGPTLAVFIELLNGKTADDLIAEGKGLIPVRTAAAIHDYLRSRSLLRKTIPTLPLALPGNGFSSVSESKIGA